MKNPYKRNCEGSGFDPVTAKALKIKLRPNTAQELDLARRCIERNAANDEDKAQLLDMLGLSA